MWSIQITKKMKQNKKDHKIENENKVKIKKKNKNEINS